MLFSHSPQVLDQVPQLSVAILSVTGVTAALDVADTTRLFLERATARLAQRPEREFPVITAWREGRLATVDPPLVDLCNAVSLAHAIPTAVFDLDQVTGNLTVRHATGTETYATFAGDTEPRKQAR